mmetsp:Transcript_27660/g.80861  ORF Transcript_27660/g.80861 Transcript_27660/m.80861 type:complete len:577 (-) Transcript_27660:73-1803(-)
MPDKEWGDSPLLGGLVAAAPSGEIQVADVDLGTPTVGSALPAPGAVLDVQNQPYVSHFPGPPIQTAKNCHGPDGCNLFIFHIPNDLSNMDLFNLFLPFGTVISARIMVEHETGRSRGFGFVSYDNRDSADAAIQQMNGFQIGRKRLKVQHKKEKIEFVSGGASPSSASSSPLEHSMLLSSTGGVFQVPPGGTAQSQVLALGSHSQHAKAPSDGTTRKGNSRRQKGERGRKGQKQKQQLQQELSGAQQAQSLLQQQQHQLLLLQQQQQQQHALLLQLQHSNSANNHYPLEDKPTDPMAAMLGSAFSSLTLAGSEPPQPSQLQQAVTQDPIYLPLQARTTGTPPAPAVATRSRSLEVPAELVASGALYHLPLDPERSMTMSEFSSFAGNSVGSTPVSTSSSSSRKSSPTSILSATGMASPWTSNLPGMASNRDSSLPDGIPGLGGALGGGDLGFGGIAAPQHGGGLPPRPPRQVSMKGLQNVSAPVDMGFGGSERTSSVNSLPSPSVHSEPCFPTTTSPMGSSSLGDLMSASAASSPAHTDRQILELQKRIQEQAEMLQGQNELLQQLLSVRQQPPFP